MPGSASASAKLQTGDECLARYSADHKFYPARITSIGGSADNRVFSVIFNGYASTELVTAVDIKPASTAAHDDGPGNKGKRGAAVLSEEDAEKERKRKKNEKKAETKQTKTLEQGLKQKSWQSFAKKSTKKGVNIPGITGQLHL